MLGVESSAPPLSDRLPGAPPDRTRHGWFRRTRNRRAVVQPREPVVVVADALGVVGRKVLAVFRVVGKVVLTLAVTAAIVAGGRLAVRHVMASPRFALKEIQIALSAHVPRDEVLELAGISEGDRLLEIDTDAVAARVAVHPWVASVRVHRQLPALLSIDITERRAAAAVTLGGLYLVDPTGHPFKRATMEEADGLPVVTGVDRAQYAEAKEATEAAFREALALLADYAARPGRPPLSEVNVDPRFGFTLFLLEGGAEVRVGRDDFSKKLARLDQIFEAVKASGPAGLGALRVVHLDHQDGTGGTRIPVRLADTSTLEKTPAPPVEGPNRKKD